MNAEVTGVRVLQALSDHLVARGVKSRVHQEEVWHRGANHTEPHLRMQLSRTVVWVAVVPAAEVYAWPDHDWPVTDPAGAASRIVEELTAEQRRAVAGRG